VTCRRLILLLLLPCLASAQRFYTYVGRIDAASVLLAWGTTAGGGNTIGLDSVSHGPATVRIAGRSLPETRKNWVEVQGLEPDREYPYEVFVGGRRTGSGKVRTWPQTARKLAFFVLGDVGTGRPLQYEVAAAMQRAFQERVNGENPVRFVLTTGDNINANRYLVGIPTSSGSQDSHWETKFFRPYEGLLRSVPFYPALGNHDGDETELSGDLPAYLDNFFFPAPRPSRYYSFTFGGLATFFALDSTNITTRERRPIYEPRGPQSQWLERELSASRSPWKIPYFHRPPFTAGPWHGASLKNLQSWVDLFGRSGVKVVFNGHEHNFQWSERDEATRGVRYVISGAGGSLRSGNIRAKMPSAHIQGWAPQPHFLLVEIEESVMTIRVLGPDPVVIRDKDGGTLPQPLRATL
jgi:hypothetical protein